MTDKTHDFSAGDPCVVISNGIRGIRYPGVVERVTNTQVHVIYDASRTRGQKSIRKSFWGKNGTQIGWVDGPRLGKRRPDEAFEEVR